MITKLTSENAELYYAPRFAQITEAFKAIGSSIEIHSLEDYFLHLTDIAALQVGAKNMKEAFLLVLPADEEIFEINANTRSINVPVSVKKNGIGVYGDHRAEMIVMTIDRYFDHEDFLNDNIVINWNFTPAGSRNPIYEENQAAVAFAPNEELNPGLVTFGFIITKDMTPGKGTLNFSVTIYDEKSNEIVYSFNTLTAAVSIHDTLTLTNPDIIKDDTSNYVGRLVNSVYVDNTISPVGRPVWKSGELNEDGSYSGLDSVAYFDADEDLNNSYNKGALLTAYAVADPNTADMFYKWSFKPVDGTIETARNFETVNRSADYIEVSELVNNGELYYEKDSLNRVDYLHPLTFAEAKAKLDEAIASQADDEIEDIPTPVFVVRGSSYQALSAGIYSVSAQARVSAGKNYEKFLGTAEQIVVNKLYYLKDENNEIVEDSPVSNDAAIEALNSGKELFVLASAARNSDIVNSSNLIIPAAIQPQVSLSMGSEYIFSDDVEKDENFDGIDYVYIDDNQMPRVIATVNIDSEDARDKAGAFAAELIESNATELDLAKIQERINDGSLQFSALPANGQFEFNPEAIEEGTYMVRIINRRNGTYSVGVTPEDKAITTSFVAPAINVLDVSAAIFDTTTEERPSTGFVPVLTNGKYPDDKLVNLEIDSTHSRYTFNIVDNTIIDSSKYKVEDISISYYIEEVEKETVEDENGESHVQYVSRTPNSDGNNPKTGRPYEYYGDSDVREVIKQEDGSLIFNITDDPGFYRIKVVSHYHGTTHTAYTDVFGVVSH